MWLTRSLAGVGSTGPWLHDGRATTLDEAILAHDGDAQMSRKNYTLLEQPQRQELLAFLEKSGDFQTAGSRIEAVVAQGPLAGDLITGCGRAAVPAAGRSG